MNTPMPLIDAALLQDTMTIIHEYFPNGIRYKSIVHQNSFKRFYYEKTHLELSDSIDMEELLSTAGILYNDKIYVITGAYKEALKNMVNKKISSGIRLFYYDMFLRLHNEFFTEAHIFSPELLRVLLEELFPSLRYTKLCFSTETGIDIESEICRCCQGRSLSTVKQTAELLPYVPYDKIQNAFIQSERFVWSSQGEYAQVEEMCFDKEEVTQCLRLVEEKIAKQGYVSFTSLDLSRNEERNPDVSLYAVRDAVFTIYLKDKYNKNGNILSLKDQNVTAANLIKQFCAGRDTVTLEELNDYEAKLTGFKSGLALSIAYNHMIRSDEQIFLSDSHINFDIAAVDSALALFVGDGIVSLRSVNSFISFPVIDGFDWNLYLLESFCRRYSRQYRFMCQCVNNKHAGAIMPKTLEFTNYAAALAKVVTYANVALTEKSVGDFLVNSGFLARRGPVVRQVIGKAQALI